MDFKKPSKKGVPKTEYKKNNLKDMAEMAQGAMQGKLLNNKVKLGIVGAVIILLIGLGTTLYWITLLIKAFPIISISIIALVIIAVLINLLKEKPTTPKTK